MTTRPLNYTTKIAASRTVGECQELLAQAGADAVAVMYAERQPTGLSFQLSTAHGVRTFAMPVNIDGVAGMLAKMLRTDAPHVSRAELTKLASRDHAMNVAWRVIRDWLEAQLALIAADMASLDEVMLPYLQVEGRRTLYQAFVENERLALTAGSTQ